MAITVIGLGSIGLRHAMNLLADGQEVLGYDVDPAAELQLMRAGGTILDDPFKPACASHVIIATPTFRHANELTLAVAHKAHVFVEKPLCANYLQFRSAKQAITSARRIGKQVFIGNNLRFHPCVKKARTFIKEGIVGKPLWANFTCAQYSEKKDYRNDGVVLNWGAHEVDLALHLLGHAELMGASIDETDSCADLMLTHESGTMTTIHLDYVTKRERRGFIIVGELGQIIADLPERHLTVYYGQKEFENIVFQGSYDDDYRDELKTFLGKETGGIGATGDDAIRATDILLGARNGYKAK